MFIERGPLAQGVFSPPREEQHPYLQITPPGGCESSAHFTAQETEAWGWQARG